MFLGVARSSRAAALFIAAIIFIVAFGGVTYNHLDSWDLPSRLRPAGSSTPTGTDANKQSSTSPSLSDAAAAANAEFRKFWFEHLHKPSIKPNAETYQPFGAFKWDVKAGAKFTKPLGEQLCIIDLDNRAFDQPNQIFGPQAMSWKNANKLHGLSMGVLNHWLYAKIHGYKYYYVAIDKYEDRRASWKKPPIISKILKKHKTCVFIDSDAIFNHLDLPFEWLMNYWGIDPSSNSLSLAVDPDRDFNKDKYGKLYLNTGFIVIQNNKKTYEIMDAWKACPDDGGAHPECVKFRLNDPGKPTDQGGFGTFIRYDFPKDIKELPCSEANGYPDSDSGCEGRFIRHLWTGKDDWIKIFVGEQVLGPYLEIFHQEFLDQKKSFYVTEKELFGGSS